MVDPTGPQETNPDGHEPDPNESDRALEQWTRRLTQALQILDLQVDRALVGELAARSTAAAGPEAAPLTTFVVGYAAGIAAAAGSATPNEASSQAADVALRLASQRHAGVRGAHGASAPAAAPDTEGWLNTAQ